MRSKLTRSPNFASSSSVGDGKQVRQEVPEHPDGEDHAEDEDKKSSSEAKDPKVEDVSKTVPLEKCALAAPSPPPMVVEEMKEMFL